MHLKLQIFVCGFFFFLYLYMCVCNAKLKLHSNIMDHASFSLQRDL